MFRLILRFLAVVFLCWLAWLSMTRLAGMGYSIVLPQWLRDWGG